MRLELGSPVRCADAPFGELADVVVDPIARRVTHLVVQPHHRHDLARLVPIDSVRAEQDGIALDRTVAEVEALEPLQESAYVRSGELPVADPDWEIGIQDVFALPLYLDPGGMQTTIAPDPDPHVMVNYDRIPREEVEIRRSSAVISADGHHVGHVDGFLVDADVPFADLVLERGHLWGRREIVIPHGAIARIETDAVTLSLSKDAVGALPTRRVHRWF